jgi:inner membrane protein
MITSILSRPELLWFIIGLALFLLELVVPGFIIFFFGFGAWITALVCLISTPGINLQIIIFALASVLSLAVLRRMIQQRFFYSKNIHADSEAVEDEFTGKECKALMDFVAGEKGKVEFKGTTWNAESESDIKKGQYVIILEKDNFNLIVKPKK